MATRRQVREAFYGELESAANGLVPAGQITQEYPNSEEDFPAIVHNDSYRSVPMNNGTGPAEVTTDSDGEQTYHYVDLMQAQFSLLVVSQDEQEKEDIYEAVRAYFEAYTHPTKDESTIQEDVHRVEVNDATSDDTTERDPPARGDRLSINVGYKRFTDRDVTPTTEVTTNVDADNDGTTDDTYTTT